ncbi:MULTISPECIES: ectoine synthase [Saccharothrix]|uniref:ectoine synthase n=1 Tax=Saccharothrix TaxID=2071 RepID=UPI000939D53A|nr:ectoine synthase [Saccharothrix sp. CB00851]OKI32007.1 L-ectoine synthase [Saccharothrix sp. CB00851]
MIVRSLHDLDGTDRDVVTHNWRSKRIILADDRVGFSMHETVLKAGTVNDFWYAHHVEAVLCVEGHGELVDKETGEVFALRPGTLYLLDNHERHQVRPITDLRTICVFNPPVTGREVHDERGAYPLIHLADPERGDDRSSLPSDEETRA